MENEEIISAQPQAENFTVRYNHQDMFLTPDEAVEFAQKGLKLDSLQPILKELDYLAFLREKSPLDTIREFIDLDGKIKEAQLKEQYGEDENGFINALNEYKKTNDLKKNELFTGGNDKTKEMDERRLVDGFFALKEKCPEIESFDKLPKEVINNAKNSSLLEAYLQFFHDEHMKIKENEELKSENLIATAGEFHNGGEAVNTLLDQFIKGINR